jgi:hypothetical protein
MNRLEILEEVYGYYILEGEEYMTKEKLYDMVLDDFIHGDIYEPQSMIKSLIMLLDSEEVEKFAQMYEYEEKAQ